MTLEAAMRTVVIDLSTITACPSPIDELSYFLRIAYERRGDPPLLSTIINPPHSFLSVINAPSHLPAIILSPSPIFTIVKPLLSYLIL